MHCCMRIDRLRMQRILSMRHALFTMQKVSHPAQLRIGVCTHWLSVRCGRQALVDGRLRSLKSMGQACVHGQIPSLQHGASVHPRTNTSITWDEYASTDENTLKNMGKCSCTDEYPPKRIRRRMNTLSKAWGKQSSVDE